MAARRAGANPTGPHASEGHLEGKVSEGSGGSVIVDRRGAADSHGLAHALRDSHSRALGKHTDAEPPAMLGGRDSLGRGLGRAPLGPPPLAHPPLGGPAPLGGIGSMGGGRIPPLGGQHTPLAPIAAAGRSAPHAAQLAPLKPLAPPAAQRSAERDGRAGMAPLKKQDRLQGPRKEAEDTRGGEGRGGGGGGGRALIGGGGGGGRTLGGGGGEGRTLIGGGGRESAIDIGPPPKSILKGPVLARAGGAAAAVGGGRGGGRGGPGQPAPAQVYPRTKTPSMTSSTLRCAFYSGSSLYILTGARYQGLVI
ncbi:translation initiation factor IF-2-like [Penaeus chinensis]|uniref:translation initiation factor IF-2-like n=1 Tax=Penaeus chinensis TaxID=139456 RepID=UPI001FB5FAE4|nr:translation initiation factor IF-2-like [Penaeus chinensis]